MRARWGGSARLTWASQRWRAGSGSLCAIQRLRRLRETGCGPRRPIRYGDGGGRARYEGYATWRRVIALSCTQCAEREGVAVPTGGGGGAGHRAGMTGSTAEVAPCPNISPGWPRPWARLRATSGRGEASLWWGGGGGGGREPVAPRSANLAAARAVVGLLPDPYLYPNPLPVHPPPRPYGSLRPPGACSSAAWVAARVAGRQSGHGNGQSLRHGNSTLCIRMRAHLPAQTRPAECVGVVKEGQAVVLAGRPYTPGARLPQGARSRPTEVRLPRGSGRGVPVKGKGGRRAGARCCPGGEVMARRSGAGLRVLAARSPRGCAQHRGSQPWAGGVPGRGLSIRAPPLRGGRVVPRPPGTLAGVRPRAAGG